MDDEVSLDGMVLVLYVVRRINNVSVTGLTYVKMLSVSGMMNVHGRNIFLSVAEMAGGAQCDYLMTR